MDAATHRPDRPASEAIPLAAATATPQPLVPTTGGRDSPEPGAAAAGRTTRSGESVEQPGMAGPAVSISCRRGRSHDARGRVWADDDAKAATPAAPLDDADEACRREETTIVVVFFLDLI